MSTKKGCHLFQCCVELLSCVVMWLVFREHTIHTVMSIVRKTSRKFWSLLGCVEFASYLSLTHLVSAVVWCCLLQTCWFYVHITRFLSCWNFLSFSLVWCYRSADGPPTDTTIGTILGGSRFQERTRSTGTVKKDLRKMTLTWEGGEVAALDRPEWRRSVAQCIHLDAGWIKVKVKVLSFGFLCCCQVTTLGESL